MYFKKTTRRRYHMTWIKQLKRGPRKLLAFSSRRKRLYANTFLTSYSFIRGWRFFLKLLGITSKRKRLHQLSKTCPICYCMSYMLLHTVISIGYVWTMVTHMGIHGREGKKKSHFLFLFLNVTLVYNMKYLFFLKRVCHNWYPGMLYPIIKILLKCGKIKIQGQYVSFSSEF